MELDKLSFPQFIRYGLTGLNAIVLLFMVPILIMKPDILPILLNTSTIIGITLFSLVVGFLLDALKLYQLSFSYKARREKFLHEFAEVLNIPYEETSRFFSLATQMSKQMDVSELEARQAHWILADHTAKILLIAIGVLFVLFFYIESLNQFILLIVTLAFYFFSMFRLFNIASIERIKSNKNYLRFAKDNREKIVSGWKIKDK